MLSLPERLKTQSAQWRQAAAQAGCDLRVAIPGIIQSFNAAEMTVTVQPAITEMIRLDAQQTPVALPLLEDVPLMIPRAGGFLLTLPVEAGDECLVIFADMCIDAWWESGGVQGQIDRRRHDLSDGFAVLAPSSQSKPVANYSATSAQLRSEDGSVIIDLASGKISLTAPAVTVKNAAGMAQALVTLDWLTWFNANVLPHISLPPGTPPPPTDSTTSVLKGV